MPTQFQRTFTGGLTPAGRVIRRAGRIARGALSTSGMRGGYGSIFIKGVFDTATYGPLLGVQWDFVLERALPWGVPYRILFAWSMLGQLQNDGSVARTTHQALELPVHSYAALVDDDTQSGWPPWGTPVAGVSGAGGAWMWPAVAEYLGRLTVGMGRVRGPRGPRRFAREAAGVDGYSAINKIAAIGQVGLVLGETWRCTMERLGQVVLARPSTQWSYRTQGGGVYTRTLPAGTYWLWRTSMQNVTAGGRWWVPILVGSWGNVLDPAEAFTFATEAFGFPGTFKARISRPRAKYGGLHQGSEAAWRSGLTFQSYGDPVGNGRSKNLPWNYAWTLDANSIIVGEGTEFLNGIDVGGTIALT